MYARRNDSVVLSTHKRSELTLADLLAPTTDLDDVKMHVVFVHGLRGDKRKTWLSGEESAFWPHWLAEDVPGVAVWSVGYTAPATRWRGSAMYLPDRAENVLALLAAQPRLATGSIAFVAHSLGGLIVKQLIRSAHRDASKDGARSSLLERIRKVAFLGTPHSGADLAVSGNIFRAIFRPSEASAGLLRNDPNLRDLTHWYRTYSNERGIETLVLSETQRTRFLGQIVKPDSADPGLAGARVIPIDANHEGICKPANRSSEIYVHVRDFVAQPSPETPNPSHFATALTDIRAAVDTGNERLLGAIKGALGEDGRQLSQSRSAPVSLADAEAHSRVDILRRSRFFVGFDAQAQARSLAEELTTGELASASGPVRAKALAWCARLLAASATADEAERILSAAPAVDTEEIRIANALLTFARGAREDALAALSGLTTATARTASLIIATREIAAPEAIQWFQQAIGQVTDLDPDGKFLLIQRYLEAAHWEDALEAAESLVDEDFVHTPALFQSAALAHLMQAVPEELRPAILHQAPFDARIFPLAADQDSLAHRRKSQDLFTQGADVASRLGCDLAANMSSDRALWLGLRDPDGGPEARKLLERSMSESSHALRRLPFALQFGVKLDLPSVEREVDRHSALSGGKSVDAAVARLAMAMTKGSEGEVADYIAKHRAQLNEYYDAGAFGGIEVEMLARSNSTAEAEARLEELRSAGLDPSGLARLQRIISEARGADPVEARIRDYEASSELVDLINLVQLLEERGDWKKLTEFGWALFERTRDLPHAELLVRALTEESDDDRLILLFRTYPELLAQSERLMTAFSWALYRSGEITEAAALLAQLRGRRDDPNDRALLVNIAVASGDWNSLLAFVEREWENRGERSPDEILRAAQLAQRLGSARASDLVREAVAKAPDDPAVLITCYSIATSGAWEDDREVSSWMPRAAELSGEGGPVQRVSLQDMIARQPEWQRRESETWDQLIKGLLPTFGAARLLNRTLGDLYLRPALTNASEADVRRRGIIFSYSGSRPSVSGQYSSIALDPTAVLTFGLLGITPKVLGAFGHVFIPHSTLGWLMEERERVKFHQPSRVKDARDLQLLLGQGALRAFEISTTVDVERTDEIGKELASMLAEAEVDAGDARQRVVIRPYPVYRVGSLMEEPADLAKHEKSLCSCSGLVDALKRLGHLTAAEEERARAYLKLNELRWPHEPSLEHGAVLYLDDVSISYLQHLNLLPKLAAAGFVAFVSRAEIEEAQALILYDSVAEQAGAILEETRRCLADGIILGTVRLGRVPTEKDEEPQLRNHPSMGIFPLAAKADALIVDDRAVNRHFNINVDGAVRPILSSLDVLEIMHSRGGISDAELAEYRTRLRRAGLALIPASAPELIDLLAVCPVAGKVVSETAELKAVRESVLRIRMSEVLQLPQEHPWLESLLRAWLDALRAQWVDGLDEEAAAARSDWLLRLVDLRGWAHRYPAGDALKSWTERYRAQILVLLIIARDKPESVRTAYWRWFESSVLSEIRHRDRETYEWLIEQAKERIEELVVAFNAGELDGEQ